MGKRLVQQRRGRGSPTHKTNSHRAKTEAKHPKEESLKAEVISIEHDSVRTAPIARIKYENGEEYSILAPESLSEGDEIEIGVRAPIEPGNTLPLAEIPEGTFIHNLENRPGDGGKFVRSSGTRAILIAHDAGKVVVQLPSKELKEFDPECRATIGEVGNADRMDEKMGKAGKKYHAKRARGKPYPKVRGVAMNAVDHPFGGGAHKHIGRPTSVSSNAPPGRKVGHLKSEKTGRGRNK